MQSSKEGLESIKQGKKEKKSSISQNKVQKVSQTPSPANAILYEPLVRLISWQDVGEKDFFAKFYTFCFKISKS